MHNLKGTAFCKLTATYSGVVFKKGNRYTYYTEIHKETKLPIYYVGDIGPSIMNEVTFKRMFNDLQSTRNAKIKEILDI